MIPKIDDIIRQLEELRGMANLPGSPQQPADQLSLPKRKTLMIDAALAIIRVFEGNTWGVHDHSGDPGITYGILGFRGDLLNRVIVAFNDFSSITIDPQATNLAELLDELASDADMRHAQEEIARKFLKQIITLSIAPRRIKTPLGQLLLMDMAVNHGLTHGFIQLFEERAQFARFQNSVYKKREVAEFPGGEQVWIRGLAASRWRNLRDDIKKSAPGLKARYDWFVAQATSGNFYLRGDVVVKDRVLNFGEVIPADADPFLPLSPPPVPAPAQLSQYSSPLDPARAGFIPPGWRVTTDYAQLYDRAKVPKNLWGHYHTGVDLWASDAYGAAIYAVADGEVTFSGVGASTWGQMTIIKHDSGISSRTAHMSVRVMFTIGQRIQRGEFIGRVGAMPRQQFKDAHLHFDLARGDLLQRDPNNWPAKNRTFIQMNYLNPLAIIKEK